MGAEEEDDGWLEAAAWLREEVERWVEAALEEVERWVKRSSDTGKTTLCALVKSTCSQTDLPIVTETCKHTNEQGTNDLRKTKKYFDKNESRGCLSWEENMFQVPKTITHRVRVEEGNTKGVTMSG